MKRFIIIFILLLVGCTTNGEDPVKEDTKQ